MNVSTERSLCLSGYPNADVNCGQTVSKNWVAINRKAFWLDIISCEHVCFELVSRSCLHIVHKNEWTCEEKNKNALISLVNFYHERSI